MAPAFMVCVVLLAGPQTAPVTTTPEELPISLDRIQRALSTKPALELKEQHPVFRLEVFGKKPTLEDILGEKFWLGPSSYGGMTHQDFMNMVTPKELQSFGPFSGTSLLQAAALSLAEQWALKQAIRKFRSAFTEHEREAARKEVLDALADLERARAAAGLPPKSP
jgi:hypothetical protein